MIRKRQMSSEAMTSGFTITKSYSKVIKAGSISESACLIKSSKTMYDDPVPGPLFKPCESHEITQTIGHEGARCSFGNISLIGEWIPGSDPVLHAGDSEIFSCGVTGYTVMEDLLPAVREEQAKAFTRVRALTPPVHMNALQSVIELKDTKQTIEPFTKFYKWARKAVRSGRKIPGLGKKLTMASTLSTCASAYLWYTFGVRPTVDDIKTFIRQVGKGQLKVKGRETRHIPKGSVVVARYTVKPAADNVLSKMYPDYSDVSEITAAASIKMAKGWIAPYSPWDGQLPVRANAVSAVEYTGAYFAEVVNSITIDGTQDLLRRLKWNCPAGATLWEVLPFSFLVDWFIDVGSLIKRMEREQLAAEYEASLGPIWHSAKVREVQYVPALHGISTAGSVSLDPSGRTATAVMSGSLSLGYVRQTVGKSYKRAPVVVPPCYWPSFTLPVKAYQITSGMALLAQAAFS